MNGLVKLGSACVFLSCAAFVGAAHATDDTSEFSIKMDRRLQTGQKLNVEARGVQQQSLLDARGQSDATAQSMVVVRLTGEATVLDVDTHGRATSLQYAVSTCSVERAGTTTEIAPAGSTLTATLRNGRTVFEVDGHSVSAENNVALQMFRLDAGGSTNDEMIGTTQPRIVGESWAIDRSRMAGELKRELRRPVVEKDLFGATTFVDMENHNGLPCAVLFTQVTADNVAPPMDEFAGRFDIRQSSMTATFEATYPKDERLPALSNSRSMTMLAVVIDETGAERQLNWSRFVEFEVKPVAGRVVTGAEVETIDD